MQVLLFSFLTKEEEILPKIIQLCDHLKHYLLESLNAQLIN